MSNRYSVYDQLNAGRQRRTTASLDDLEATIGGIEAKLDKMRGYNSPNSGYSDEIADRMRMLGNQVAGLGRQAPPVARDNRQSQRNQEGLAREIERMRREETDQTQINAIFSELQLLRGEMKRLASGTKQDDWGAALRQEIEAIKHGIGSLAREDTLRSVENRWSEFAQPSRNPLENDAVIDTLIDRIDAIQSAVSGLSQSLPIASLEEKIRVLAGAIDQMSRRSPEINPQHLMQIEDRLDEISRAIVASSVSVQAVNGDKSSFDRIEARLSALNGRLEEIANADPARDVQSRIEGLSQHIEQIAQSAGEPSEHIVRMASQMEAIADRLEQLDSRKADVDAVTRTLESRLADLASKLDQPVADHSGEIFDLVERRFADLSSKIDLVPASSGIDAGFADTIERRLSDITQRLNQSTAPMPSMDSEAMARLEEQVANLSKKLAVQPAATPLSGEIDLRLASIESKLSSNQEELLAAARYAAEEALRNAAAGGLTAGQSETVAQLAADLKSLDHLARKSDDRNTRTFEAIHDTLLKVVERLGSLEVARPAAPAAAFDATRASVKVEADTFDMPAVASKPMQKMDLGSSTPSFDIEEDAPLEDFSPVPVRSPAEAALAAANAAREQAASGGKNEAAKPAKGGIFSGLTKALGREPKPSSTELLPEMPGARVEPQLAGNAPVPPMGDVSAAIDPISGAPDLNAIMKRVRDERKGRADSSPDMAAKNDFLAAARRAAQAAAADAEILKNKTAKAQKAGGSSITELLQRQRKPILMGALAIMLALTGLQLGKAFFGRDVEQAAVAPPVSATADTADNKASALPQDMDSESKTVMPAEPVEAAPGATAQDQGVRVIEPVEPQDKAAVPTSAASAPAPQSADVPAMSRPVTTSDVQESVAAAAPVQSTAALDSIPAETGPLALREAAASGDGKALFEIGSRYADGRGVAKDAKKATEWYRKAADAGFAPAQFRLGSLYEKGIGVERSPDNAKTLYQLAAEQGNASAMHNLAVLFAMGAAGPVDNESAAKWFVKAAELGVKDSQFNLGILAAKGLGVPQNLEESYKWFALAAKAGDKDAASKRDEIANAMRPEQLQKARAAAELWKAKVPAAEGNSIDIPDAWNSDASETASTPPAGTDMVKAIRNIQIILNQNGYDAGNPDGKMGAKTKKAIAAYQKANGMEATGEVTEALVKSLLKKVKS